MKLNIEKITKSIVLKSFHLKYYKNTRLLKKIQIQLELHQNYYLGI